MQYQVKPPQQEFSRHQFTLFAGKHILVVDDEIEMITLLVTILEREGFRVSKTQSGANALDFLNQSNPDLIILDLMMPEIDGLKFLELAQDNPSINDIPVLVLSARSDTSIIMTAITMGANDYLTKPFERHILLKKIRLIFEDEYA